MNASKEQRAVASYITDMLALESHIQKAIAGQIADLDGESSLVSSLRVTERMCQSHMDALSALAQRRELTGQGVSEMIKSVASNILGAGAAAVDFVRGEKLPKNLRDDYTALSLACIGYVMLHTVGMSLEDQEVADLAQEHLADHAKCVMTFHNLIPVAVIDTLREEGLAARTDVLEKIGENIQHVWRSESGVPQTHEAFAAAASSHTHH